MRDKQQDNSQFADTILADCLELRREVRQMRKKLWGDTDGNPLAGLFTPLADHLFIGAQIGVSICIRAIKRQLAGRANKKSFAEQLARMAGMEIVEREKQEEGGKA